MVLGENGFHLEHYAMRSAGRMKRNNIKYWIAVAIVAFSFLSCDRQRKRPIEILPPPTPVTDADMLHIPGTNKYYTVEKGDTIFKVSVIWGVPRDILKATNNLTGKDDHTPLTVGKFLIIPDVEESQPVHGTNVDQMPIL